MAEPELEPKEEALVGIGEGNAGDLFRACEPVTAGVGMNIEVTSRCGDIAAGVEVGQPTGRQTASTLCRRYRRTRPSG
jgi:hypothetical protein